MMKKTLFVLIFNYLLISNPAIAQSPFTAPDSLLTIQTGIASYYGTKFHNRMTANGEIYNMWAFTAAHKHLPFGTRLKVTNLNNGFQAIVKINDRLPKSSKRIIDLSKGVAEHLEMVNDGIVPVKLELLSHQAIEWVRKQYKTVPRDIRLRSYNSGIAFQNEKEAVEFRNFILQE